MALVANATKLSMDASKRPTGYTDPGGTNLSNSQPTYSNLALNVTRSVVEAASKSTTFNQIRTNETVGIEKQVSDLLTVNIENTIQTVTYNIDWKDIRNNRTFPGDFYGNAVEVYVAIVDVYVNIS